MVASAFGAVERVQTFRWSVSEISLQAPCSKAPGLPGFRPGNTTILIDPRQVPVQAFVLKLRKFRQMRFDRGQDLWASEQCQILQIEAGSTACLFAAMLHI